VLFIFTCLTLGPSNIFLHCYFDPVQLIVYQFVLPSSLFWFIVWLFNRSSNGPQTQTLSLKEACSEGPYTEGARSGLEVAIYLEGGI
jgi:hypothetical protein